MESMDNIKLIRESVLEDAKQCVCKDRNNIYGGPEDNFSCIAKFWNTYLNNLGNDNLGNDNLGNDVSLSPKDAAIMMTLFKLARLITANSYHRDSWVDAIGYLACGSEIDAMSNSANKEGES